MSRQPEAQARDAAGIESPPSSGQNSLGELTFMMGQFAALFPTDRLFARNHMWAQWRAGDVSPPVVGETGASNHRGTYVPRSPVLRFGFTAYAVRLLQDVYFLDWSVDAGTLIREKQQIGSIESKKAESDLFSPLAGVVVAFNQVLLADPSAINVDKYGNGWLFEMEASSVGLLSPEKYIEHLSSVWEVTQRTIKGQLNE